MSTIGGKTGRRFIVAGALLLIVGAVLFLTVTSSGPWTPPPRVPSAEDVAAGRDAYRQLRIARGNRNGVPVNLGAAQLTGLSVVASHGLRPDRITIAVEGDRVVVHASHRLSRFGRWLNVAMTAEGPTPGFPKTHLKIGVWDLPAWLSRTVFQLGRLYIQRRVDVPPLDLMVRNFKVERGTASALISLPTKSGVVDDVASTLGGPVDRDTVLRVYCALTDAARKKPSGDFAEQVRRAFSLEPGSASRPDFNRAAFLALGMFVVDERVGDFADLTDADLGKCRMPVAATAIYGRQDWPKHWALSAAIAVGAGTQLSEAAGEWKELVDSLARQSRFAMADPTGFSMADLAADRSGFRTARLAWQGDDAERIAAALAHATPQQLLPPKLVIPEVALSNADFVRRYGSVDDPRFKRKLQEIDAVVDAEGLH